MKEFFQERVNLFQSIETEFRKKGCVISNIRWSAFLIFIIGLIWLFSAAFYYEALLLTGVFLLCYIPLVIYHKKLNFRADFNKVLKEINQEEILRINGNIEQFESGSRYYDVLHPYTKDLDIFGKYSLFQYVNRCSTEPGMDLLASWLKAPAGIQEIKDRQSAVRELAEYVEFRQNLQAEGKLVFIGKQQIEKLREWTNTSEKQFSGKNTWITLDVLNLSTLIIFFVALISGTWKLLLIPVTANIIFLNRRKEAIKKMKETTEEVSAILKALSRIFQLLEKQEVKSPRLVKLKAELFSADQAASQKIEKLASLFEMLEYTTNPYFYTIANLTFLWDLHWCRRLEVYKQKMSGGPESWLNILFEYEAVSCLAGLNYIQKKWSFPQIVADGFTYDASQISHPLIFKGKAVANDFVLNDNPATWIITGSNMSGKSTFLRTLGINAVLAFAGAPVAASEMKLSRFLVFTSMRTEDNLQESTSSFYAELKRLKQLLEYINDQIPVFYLLDEILKGTNSSDRNTGGKALIRQLQGTNSSGIIATHDIELSNLEKEAPGKIYNFSFSSDVTDGQLFFDYKLKEGVCRSFNATELMRQIGIQVDLGR